MKILCLYNFHEINGSVINFIKNCLFEDKNIDFLLISNNLNITKEHLNLPNYCSFVSRENTGFDFGGWSYGLLTGKKYLYYDYFILCNCSITGPFLRNNHKKWTDSFINGLENNVRIFGPTINCRGLKGDFQPHVQSYFFSMNKETLEFLIEKNIFSLENIAKSYHQAILEKEILMSKLILENGWNIGCFLKCYDGYDFTKIDKKSKKYYGDLMFPRFQNKAWIKEDLIFIKSNRGILY